ncbi:MAG TPA: DUF5667 domain-containing protein [Mycobacteriales bacterium]|nr:DUF5667 domain-containing protein [Mycobacteriales bacterium]
MTNTIERFAQLIDLDSPPDYLDGGDPRMRPAVEIAAALRHAATVAAPPPMSESTKRAMRQQLVAAASAPPAESAVRKISRRVTTLIGSVVIVTSVAGVGVAAARALPGSPFYDIKRATEAVQLWVTSGEAAKGQRHLEFAETRLAEASRLPASSPYLASTLKAMDDEVRQANTDLVQDYRKTGDVTPLADLVKFARGQADKLAVLGSTLPASLHQEASYSANLLTGVTQEVRSLTIGVCQQCAPGAAPSSTPVPTLAPSPTPSTHPTGTRPASKPTGSSPATSPKPAATGPLKGILPPLPSGSANKVLPLPELTPVPLLSSLAQLLTGG